MTVAPGPRLARPFADLRRSDVGFAGGANLGELTHYRNRRAAFGSSGSINSHDRSDTWRFWASVKPDCNATHRGAGLVRLWCSHSVTRRRAPRVAERTTRAVESLLRWPSTRPAFRSLLASVPDCKLLLAGSDSERGSSTPGFRTLFQDEMGSPLWLTDHTGTAITENPR